MGNVSENALHVGLASAITADLMAAIHADNDIAHTEHLFNVGRSHHHQIAAVAELPNQPIDFGASADIDTARRLVHQKHARLFAADPAAERELLLVAPA